MPHAAPYRYFGAFRLLLALLVVVQHALRGLFPPGLSEGLLPMEVGSTAVLMFFVLSGFIVAEAADRVYAARPGAFLLNRLIRIYPTYLVALLLMIGVLRLLQPLGEGVAAATVLNQITDLSGRNILLNLLAILPGANGMLDRLGGTPILGLAWALRIEMLFYFVLFAHLAAGAFLRVAPARLLAVSGVVGLTAYAVLLPQLRSGSLEFFPYFVLGVAAYYLDRDRSAVAGWIVAVAALQVGLHLGLQPTRQSAVPLAELAGGLVVLGWIILTSGRGRQNPTTVAHDRFLGDLTYPLYLTHYCGLMLAGAVLPLFSVPALELGFVLSFAIAYATTRWFERPLSRLRSTVRGFSLSDGAASERRQRQERGRTWSDRVLRISG